MKGILADVNVLGHVEYLVRIMQAEPWTEFWNGLGLSLFRFEDVGLDNASGDADIWKRCQAHQLILITNNRNDESPDPLEAIIRKYNTNDSLPVLTVGNLGRLAVDVDDTRRVVERL